MTKKADEERAKRREEKKLMKKLKEAGKWVVETPVKRTGLRSAG